MACLNTEAKLFITTSPSTGCNIYVKVGTAPEFLYTNWVAGNYVCLPINTAILVRATHSNCTSGSETVSGMFSYAGEERQISLICTGCGATNACGQEGLAKIKLECSPVGSNITLTSSSSGSIFTGTDNGDGYIKCLVPGTYIMVWKKPGYVESEPRTVLVEEFMTHENATYTFARTTLQQTACGVDGLAKIKLECSPTGATVHLSGTITSETGTDDGSGFVKCVVPQTFVMVWEKSGYYDSTPKTVTVEEWMTHTTSTYTYEKTTLVPKQNACGVTGQAKFIFHCDPPNSTVYLTNQANGTPYSGTDYGDGYVQCLPSGRYTMVWKKTGCTDSSPLTVVVEDWMTETADTYAAQDVVLTCSGNECITAGTKRCSPTNNKMPQLCTGTPLRWVDQPPECVISCALGSCTTQCIPGTKQCAGNTPQTCSAQGTWVNGTPCVSPQTCVSGTCQGGQCPVCSATLQKCDSSTNYKCACATPCPTNYECVSGATICTAKSITCSPACIPPKVCQNISGVYKCVDVEHPCSAQYPDGTCAASGYICKNGVCTAVTPECIGMERDGKFDITCILEEQNKMLLYGSIGLIALLLIMKKKKV